MRLKDVTEFCPAYTGAARNDAVAFVPMEALRYDSIAQQEIPFEEARGKYTFFADGDLLFAKVTPCFENGNIAVANNLKGGIGFGSSEIFVLRAKPCLNNRYLFYVVQASPFMDGGCATMCGVGGLKRMSPLFPRTFEWEIPNENLQRKIVAYLDEKSAAIDARVAILEKKLSAFKRLKASIINRAVTRGLDPKAKLKDSGVEWIGKVPVGWNTKRVKDVGAAWNGLTYSPEDVCDEDNGVLVLRSSNIQDGRLDYTDCVYVDCNVANLARVKRGDVLICSRNGSAALVGKNALIETDVSAAFGAFMLVFRGGREIEKRYAHYVFNARMFESYMGGFATSTIHQLLRSDFLNMEMPYPPPDEQIAIADYLDAECAKINKMAELVTREIELYKKLKRSLINEVVTGKRPVFADKQLRRGKEVA